MRKMLFHLYFLFKRPMTMGVRAIVVDRDDRILLVRHTYVKGWYFPGGGVEVGQTMEQALEMELREEVNILEMGAVKLLGIYLNRKISKRDHVGLYLCKDWRDMGVFTANREIAEIGFFARDQLPDGTTPGTLRRLAEIFDGAKASTEW